MALPDALAVAGGTDIFPAHVGKPVRKPVVDLTRVEGLSGISEADGTFRIGGATTWTAIASASLPPAFDGLRTAAREVGSIQIQNRGTIAGNLCNASPAADGIPPLLALDASVELQSMRGTRTLALKDFITGYRATALEPGEIVTAVIVPAPSSRSRSAFVKLGARRYLVISILMAAAVIERGRDGSIVHAAIAVGAASAVAQRLPALEAALIGLEMGTLPSSIITEAHLAPLSPIDDVRATAAYRLDAARTVIGQAIDRAAGDRP